MILFFLLEFIILTETAKICTEFGHNPSVTEQGPLLPLEIGFVATPRLWVLTEGGNPLTEACWVSESFLWYAVGGVSHTGVTSV